MVLRVFADGEDGETVAALRAGRDGGVDGLSYDGIGRTVECALADGASASTYSYLGNTVTSTDASGAWKTFAMDAAGM